MSNGSTQSTCVLPWLLHGPMACLSATTQVPKRKPQLLKGRQDPPKDPKPPARPKKFTAFSPSDSRRLEARYQKLLEAAEDSHGLELGDSHTEVVHARGPKKDKSASTESRQTSSAAKSGLRVRVNEDFLFDVDIEDRELAPVYWLGPVYEGKFITRCRTLLHS